MIIKITKHHLIIFQEFKSNLILRLILEEKKLNLVIYRRFLQEIKSKVIHMSNLLNRD